MGKGDKESVYEEDMEQERKDTILLRTSQREIFREDETNSELYKSSHKETVKLYRKSPTIHVKNVQM